MQHISSVTDCCWQTNPEQDIQGLLATSPQHKFSPGQGCVPGANTSQAKGQALSVKKGITGWMTQLLKYKSVIMCVSNTERRFCFFWTLIMHWVTTPTPTSIVLTGYTGAGLAKETSHATLPSFLLVGKFTSISMTEKARTGQQCRFPLACPAQPWAVTLTDSSGAARSGLWRAITAQCCSSLGCFAALIQHASKTVWPWAKTSCRSEKRAVCEARREQPSLELLLSSHLWSQPSQRATGAEQPKLEAPWHWGTLAQRERAQDH